jgi:hypothetical protein
VVINDDGGGWIGSTSGTNVQLPTIGETELLGS